MRKCVAASILLFVTASLTFSVQNNDWLTYTSAEGRYSVSLPAKPTLSTQDATTADGLKFVQYLAMVVGTDDVAFLVCHFDGLPGTVFSADAARDGMVKRINGTLISESAISLQGFPGRELKVLTTPATPPPAEGAKPAEPVDYIVRARFYEADKRIYILQIIFPKSLDNEETAAKASKYFESFQIVKD